MILTPKVIDEYTKFDMLVVTLVEFLGIFVIPWGVNL